MSIRNDQITLSRYQYGAQILDLMGVSWQKDEYHKIRIVAENNRITVYVDDMDAPAMDIYDVMRFCPDKLACVRTKRVVHSAISNWLRSLRDSGTR